MHAHVQLGARLLEVSKYQSSSCRLLESYCPLFYRLEFYRFVNYSLELYHLPLYCLEFYCCVNYSLEFYLSDCLEFKYCLPLYCLEFYCFVNYSLAGVLDPTVCPCVTWSSILYQLFPGVLLSDLVLPGVLLLYQLSQLGVLRCAYFFPSLGPFCIVCSFSKPSLITIILQMVYTSHKKLRILHYHAQGYKPYAIAKVLEANEGLKLSRFGVAKFLKHYKETGAITRKPDSGRPSKVTREIKLLVDEQMKQDDETTAYQLHSLLVSKGYNISLETILRCRTSLEWTFRALHTAN